jgi:hypothetical protein
MFTTPAMAGLGHQGPEPALALTDNMVVIGTRPMVEQALRGATARPLAADPICKQALSALPSGPIVSWGFTNTSRLLEAIAAAGAPMGAELPLDDEELQKALAAPSVWAVQSTSDGLVGTVRTIVPKEAAVQVSGE